VGQTQARLKEAAKQGFSQAILPAGGKARPGGGMALTQMPDLTGFVGEVFGAG
jgi:DNA repair protein RadA/Sms